MITADYSTRNNIAVVTLNNPPVNGLGHELRAGIVVSLDRANADPAIEAILLIGEGKGFSAGADIREFGSDKALAEPTLKSVIHAVATSHKPVIAAVHGMAMGGGLELALGCHYRLASPPAKIALPEVKLGILPGAGGTQLLPRIVGLERALQMILSGDPVSAEKLGRDGLFDELVSGDLLEGALAFATRVAKKRPMALASQRKVEHPDTHGVISAARSRVAATSRGYPAPLKCVEAVAASVSMPFAEGLAFERELFTELVATSESKALRHAFFAERTTTSIAGVSADTSTRPITKAAVIGAGTMGTGIAMAFVNAGLPVTLLEVSQEMLDRGLETICKTYEGRVSKGKITPAQMNERMGLIEPALSYASVAQADVAVEAVFEEMSVKKSVFEKLDEVMKPGAILASNTSTLDLNAIAGFTKRPQDVVGTHFFSPAHVMRLLEIVRGERTAKDVLATVMALAKGLGKIGVVSRVCDGFIGNRMLASYMRQCLQLLEEGAMPAQVDRALETWGMAMGPFRVLDLAGNDIGWSIRKRQYAENPETPRQVMADRLCELGRFGQKTGAGWYRYAAGSRQADVDPAVEEMVRDYSRDLGLERRQVTDGEIVERCIFALVNEGARILEEGIAQRASDIDVVYLAGYGFPRFRGGPMHYAGSIGLDNVVRAIQRLAANSRGDPNSWKPARLLADLAARGRSFT